MQHYVRPVPGGGFVGSTYWLGNQFGVFQRTPERERCVGLYNTQQEAVEAAAKLNTAT